MDQKRSIQVVESVFIPFPRTRPYTFSSISFLFNLFGAALRRHAMGGDLVDSQLISSEILLPQV